MFDNNQKITYNFRDLKHNLYDVYNLDNKCSIDDVKKKYKKLMLKFHPDKSSDLEEEIFNHIVIGYKILSDPVLRADYDYFIEFNNNNTLLEFNELKNNFKSFKTEDTNSVIFKEAQNKYDIFNKELEKKHKVNESDFNVDVEKKFNEMMKDRENLNLKPDELLKPLINNFNKDIFDERFKEIKVTENNQMLNISKSGEIMTYTDNKTLSKYSNFDYNNLYIEDSVIDDKFCSLDNAFKLNPEITLKNINVKNKMDEYKNMTKELENVHVKKRDV
ncbi:putative DnaJ/Hsp40 [Chlorella virus XW01]|nr:putative DnaJ/Hsp40 [Chlorella virus XW01]